ncbi:putative TFIIF-stimulated CTD phosphatase [Trypanosoma conorhini]|uniref:Mitochondrial import inner membrane translocase subunit TIM50 n=1 Tax=Trypanosoma conorhini TaxID=83891 RepID=A0A422PJA5_9TRYP|nr:putative TFIIF-stimulated CTD phosphatase [Trypanosoma conorhini]RNF17793.1 putative TFIIF-stimulated CTD phosphatase [Trypanosoma conorhini]
MSDQIPMGRQFLNTLHPSHTCISGGGGGGSMIKSYWHNQLRASGTLFEAKAASPSKDRATSASDLYTPASGSSSGLTESCTLGLSAATSPRSASFRSPSSFSSCRRRLRAAARSAERHGASDIRERFGALAKPLFQNFLLPQVEAHETRPALTVVLDLDETLVSNRNGAFVSAILRPYCLHVLNALRHMRGLEVVLWTASTKETALPVVEQLNQSGPVFDEVIYRNDMWFTEPLHTKDLRLLGRDMDRLLIIDNAANCCKLNPRNSVLADDFYGCRTEEDATLVNVYYIIDRVLRGCHDDVPVRDTLLGLATDGQLCSPYVLTLPDAWKSLPLREIAPLKIPPHGRFTRSHRQPLGEAVMRHWTM